MTRQRVINMRNPMSRSTHRFPSGSPEISHYCTGGGINQNCCSGFYLFIYLLCFYCQEPWGGIRVVAFSVQLHQIKTFSYCWNLKHGVFRSLSELLTLIKVIPVFLRDKLISSFLKLYYYYCYSYYYANYI